MRNVAGGKTFVENAKDTPYCSCSLWRLLSHRTMLKEAELEQVQDVKKSVQKPISIWLSSESSLH